MLRRLRGLWHAASTALTSLQRLVLLPRLVYPGYGVGYVFVSDAALLTQPAQLARSNRRVDHPPCPDSRRSRLAAGAPGLARAQPPTHAARGSEV
jgi:hypothetical protein